MYDKYEHMSISQLRQEITDLGRTHAEAGIGPEIDALVLARLRVATLVTGFIAASFASAAVGGGEHCLIKRSTWRLQR